MNVILILFLYVIIVNIVGFAMMGIDKRKAKEARSVSRRPIFFSPPWWAGASAVSPGCIPSVIKPSIKLRFRHACHTDCSAGSDTLSFVCGTSTFHAYVAKKSARLAEQSDGLFTNAAAK